MPDEEKAPASSDVVIESFRAQMEILQLMRKDAKSASPIPRSSCSWRRRTRGCATRARRTEPTPRLPVLAEPRLQIVLLHPEIPNNTGAIGRTAAATGCRLHIVHPIGFDMGERARRRAGLDYWHLVDCVEHASWEAFVARRTSAARARASGSTRRGRAPALGGVVRAPATTCCSAARRPARRRRSGAGRARSAA